MLKITSNTNMENLKKEIARLKSELETALEVEEKEYIMDDIETAQNNLIDAMYEFLLEQLDEIGYLDLSDNRDNVAQVLDANKTALSGLDIDEILVSLLERILDLSHKKESEYVTFSDESSFGTFYKAIFKKVDGLEMLGQYEAYHNINLNFYNCWLETAYFEAKASDEDFSERGAFYKLNKFIEDLKNISYDEIRGIEYPQEVLEYALSESVTTRHGLINSKIRDKEFGKVDSSDINVHFEAIKDGEVVLEVNIDSLDFAEDIY